MNTIYTHDIMCCSDCQRLFRDTSAEQGWQREGTELICRHCIDGSYPSPIWVGVALVAVATLLVFIAMTMP
jgi:hypothetical protein